MKAIIPVAGAGTKLRPHSYTQPKALIPLAGKTVLSIIIDQMLEAGIDEFVFIVGYLGDKIRDYVKAKYPDLKAHYVQQIDRQGIGHAIQITREVVNDDEVMVVLGDTICDYNVKAVVESDCSMLGVRKVDDPREFGVAEIDENGFIDHVVEKPHIPKSNMALVGIYKIKESQQLFQCLESNYMKGLRTHGEYSLTDALDCMLKQGVKFKPFKVETWFDCGRKDTLLESNATLLKKFDAHNTIQHQFENTVIIPPVSIGEGCDIKNSIIGPDVTIGENTRINYSIVRNSIIGSFSNLFDIVLEASIIGSDTGLKGETRTLSIGDNTNIDLG
ncbi:NTP transferase domain-containing protein [Terrimonas sp. NA20]|uniref:NTP transferase domain-containing protein n=1 Tax=Terrimonas ginsenosidimutans TaxID=2908004 RepID=A0ABS9KWB5_9BACT|nr:sugar phosphate nucleotidyltransferase [Terrimonas ginsenosidimutans]MCG2616524.1 NTP transferase domain-containing protein [Terrimonas ginsenosidimutans]